MKRFASILSSLLLLVVGVLSFTACTPKVTDFSTADVVSNGNLGVVKDGNLYYINRVTTDRTLKGSDCDKFGIYKVAVDANCAPTGEATLLYSTLAGFEDGQLFIFGDYIYFATPAGVTSASAERLTGRTSFCRVGLDGKNYKLIYTTQADVKEPSYAYYVYGDMLYLVVLENEELNSIKMDKKFSVTNIDTEVTSVALSETQGLGGNAEQYIFYTKEPTETFITQTGHNVYRSLPDGKNAELISSGQNVTLLRVVNGYLYYLLDEATINRTTTIGGFATGDAVSYVSYEKFIILSDGGIVAQDKDSSQTWYYNWTSGSMVSRCLVASVSYNLLFEHNGYVYMQNTASSETKFMVRVNTELTNQTVSKLTEVAIVEAGNFINYEVIGSTLYYFEKEVSTDDAGNEVTYSKLSWAKLA